MFTGHMLYNMFHRMCARQSIGLEVRHHLGAGVDVNFGIDRSRAGASCVVAVLAVVFVHQVRLRMQKYEQSY